MVNLELYYWYPQRSGNTGRNCQSEKYFTCSSLNEL